jgi:hypothetical protein
MKTIKYIICLMCLLSLQNIFAQQKKVIDFVGGARSIMGNNRLVVNDSIADTTTVKRNTGGYALVDLGVNIRPNKSTEILGMFRIQNGYGGFWGSGVNFDVRQLWLKGLVGNIIRYQLGDLNLKQTPYTLYNHHADRVEMLPDIFAIPQSIINYEKFYTKNNTWRQQGASVDFGFTFQKYLQELNVNAYTTRLRATDFSTNPDRLMSGVTTQFVVKKNLKVAYHLFSVNDIFGTVIDSNLFNNTIHSGSLDYALQAKNIPLQFHADFGKSKAVQSLKIYQSLLQDYFVNAFTQINLPKQKSAVSIGYLNVGPEYRSIGAQSKDINYNLLTNEYNLYTNGQRYRPLQLLDVLTNVNLYNQSVSNNLMAKNEVFNNAMPYGEATFNRIGMYVKGKFEDTAKGIQAQLSQYNLSEIQGQGTLNLTKYAVTKLNSEIAIHKIAKMKNIFKVQLGLQLQSTNRKSTEVIENIELNSTSYQAGLQYEIFPKIDVLAGIIAINTKGNEFTTKPEGCRIEM